MKILLVLSSLLCVYRASASTAGFIKSPLSQMKLLGGWAELQCEVVGDPLPEVQWWFVEGHGPEETLVQLFDGAREGRMAVNATYVAHATSSVVLGNLSLSDSGTYECRASNDPDRNELKKTPKIKWIRSQANVLVFEQPLIVTNPAEVSNQTSALLSCNLTAPTSPIKGSFWMKNDVELEGTRKSTNQAHIVFNLTKISVQTGGQYKCVFVTEPEVSEVIEVKTPLHVSAYKHSEQGNERDRGVMVCHGYGYPLPTDWAWRKMQPDGTPLAIANATLDKYEIKTTPNKTTLSILDLDMEQDMGDYECLATSELGIASDKIHLRVRSRLAALWPFLGIVAEVIILVTIIFIYEKRRTPDEISDDDDSGSAPLKSNSTNHKEKNVRQRNSN